VFIILLREYDFKWDGKAKKEHPASYEIEGQFLPNLTQRICIKAKESNSFKSGRF
jgi:hypothetical protein